MNPRFLKSTTNRKGQFLIEGVLLMSLSIGLLVFAVKIFRDKKVIAQMIETPWNNSTGMIECGIWGQAKKECGKHPNMTNLRGITLVEIRQ